MTKLFEKLSLMIPRGLDDFTEKLMNREYSKLFKNPEHFISIGSILIFVALFLITSVTLN